MRKIAMISTKVIVSALALMGFALGASAHDSPNGDNEHVIAYDCNASVSGSYVAGEENIAHGKANELGRISTQGRVRWMGSDTACNSGPGLTLDNGYSVTRAANGDLVFVTYTAGSNCPGGLGDAISDLEGMVTGGTGRFADAGGQLVHTVSDIYVTSADTMFGGTVTVSNNQCLND